MPGRRSSRLRFNHQLSKRSKQKWDPAPGPPSPSSGASWPPRRPRPPPSAQEAGKAWLPAPGSQRHLPMGMSVGLRSAGSEVCAPRARGVSTQTRISLLIILALRSPTTRVPPPAPHTGLWNGLKSPNFQRPSEAGCRGMGRIRPAPPHTAADTPGPPRGSAKPHRGPLRSGLPGTNQPRSSRVGWVPALPRLPGGLAAPQPGGQAVPVSRPPPAPATVPCGHPAPGRQAAHTAAGPGLSHQLPQLHVSVSGEKASGL